jgi:hypothetical protein
VDQELVKIELNTLHLMDYLFVSKDPVILEKNQKYCQKPGKFRKTTCRFVQKVDQSESRVDQDRTQRTLSDRLITFLLRPRHLKENPKYRQKAWKFLKNRSPFKQNQRSFQIELDKLYRFRT